MQVNKYGQPRPDSCGFFAACSCAACVFFCIFGIFGVSIQPVLRGLVLYMENARDSGKLSSTPNIAVICYRKQTHAINMGPIGSRCEHGTRTCSSAITAPCHGVLCTSRDGDFRRHWVGGRPLNNEGSARIGSACWYDAWMGALGRESLWHSLPTGGLLFRRAAAACDYVITADHEVKNIELLKREVLMLARRALSCND